MNERRQKQKQEGRPPSPQVLAELAKREEAMMRIEMEKANHQTAIRIQCVEFGLQTTKNRSEAIENAQAYYKFITEK